jgi:Asp-tRNA(Asn)/Glu-tRNA(Gln) amidotransferase A subunit family amidase
VEVHLARIAAVNGAVNAVTVVLAEQARAAADAAVARRWRPARPWARCTACR